MSPKSYLIKRLADLVQRDHGGCEDTTCTISAALSNGFDLVAIECWAGSGAADAEFYKLHAKLPAKYKMCGKAYSEDAERFNRIPAVGCGCGAYIYEPKIMGFHCSSCGKTLKESVK